MLRIEVAVSSAFRMLASNKSSRSSLECPGVASNDGTFTASVLLFSLLIIGLIMFWDWILILQMVRARIPSIGLTGPNLSCRIFQISLQRRSGGGAAQGVARETRLETRAMATSPLF